MAMKRTYFSIDIETDGLCPGLNSMLSLGACAFNPLTGEIMSRFKMNLKPLEGAHPDPDTMAWWQQFPEAWERATKGALHPLVVIQEFIRWVDEVAGNDEKVVCYWKPEFDGSFIRYYLFLFHDSHIFGRSGSGLDIKTLASIALDQPYAETQIAKVPREWTDTGQEHNHDACDDAVEQAKVCYYALRSLRENQGLEGLV